jgi:hypothetical protein
MKTILFVIVLVGVLIACKNNEEVFKPTCTNFVLEKVDWTYCDPIRLLKCGDKRDTLVRKTVFSYQNEEGIIKYTSSAGYCLESLISGKSLTPLNLPECLKKSNLKVKFSGLEKVTHHDASCGNEFEITKIEEIP